MTSIVPPEPLSATARLFFKDNDVLEHQLILATDTIMPGTQQQYDTGLYLGPKSLSVLRGIGFDLQKAVNFGFSICWQGQSCGS